jgi:hypothetical protein
MRSNVQMKSKNGMWPPLIMIENNKKCPCLKNIIFIEDYLQ